jgi:hypothetical protein
MFKWSKEARNIKIYLLELTKIYIYIYKLREETPNRFFSIPTRKVLLIFLQKLSHRLFFQHSYIYMNHFSFFFFHSSFCIHKILVFVLLLHCVLRASQTSQNSARKKGKKVSFFLFFFAYVIVCLG